jgi:hypothetical protein
MGEKLSTTERERREKQARDGLAKRLKSHYDKQGKTTTGTAIEKEVASIQRRIEREKDHTIYKD